MIKVVNKYKHEPTNGDVYIGRGSIFGSPFSHIQSKHPQLKEVFPTREEAVEAYRKYFYGIIDSCGCKHKKFKGSLRELIVRLKLGEDINLVCFCKPKACHGDVIKEYILNNI